MYWLMKSEPDVYSIDDLARDKTTWWDGVRNYQARNYMMNDMKVGDQVLFYHSNSEPSGVAGIARVSAVAQPDKSALDKKSKYYDEKATTAKPIWYCVQVEFVRKLSHFVSLAEIKAETKLAGMKLVQRGDRLSVQPVSQHEFDHIVKMGTAPK